jgi:hypothetical protein
MKPLLIILVVAPLFAVLADWPPPGKATRVEVSRDTWVTSAGSQQNDNLGKHTKLKTKGIQEFPIVDIDPKALQGQVITGATFHFKVSGKERQHRLTFSTLAGDWKEGTSHRYAEQKGSASFNWARQDETPWAFPGSNMVSAMNGVGNTIWRFADPTPPDKNGWQTVAVDPAIVQARIAEVSTGFVIMDDVGSEYTRNGNSFTFRNFPNRYMFSRDGGKANAPYFTLYVSGRDTQPPAAIGEIIHKIDPHSVYQASLAWRTPKDSGTGAIGFDARWSTGAFDWKTAKPVPRYLIPMAGKADDRVIMQLRDLEAKPGATITVGVRAVDGAGNASAVKTTSVKLAVPVKGGIPRPKLKVFPDEGHPLPKVAGVELAVVDVLDSSSTLTRLHQSQSPLVIEDGDGAPDRRAQ